MTPPPDEVWRLYLQGVDKMPDPKCAGPSRALPRIRIARVQDDAVKPFVLSCPETKIEPLSKKTRRAYAGGRSPLDAQIDLHGMTQDKAFAALVRFVKKQAQLGARRLLVITGKGKEGASVLRQNLPRWCADRQLSPFIAALHEAAPPHGGTGAFYVRLRQASSKGSHE